MIEALSFDDVLIIPEYSTIKSRKDVSTVTKMNGITLEVPIISSNMDTITESEMAKAMHMLGAGACLHRFNTVNENKQMHKASPNQTMVSIGVGAAEFDRALALFESGAETFVIDVAHGAAQHVVEQYDNLRAIVKENANIIVGNFATGISIRDFKHQLKSRVMPDAYKIGIGGGSLCTTRVVTGCGLPTFQSILDCRDYADNLIADGGIRNSGDIVKALAAGAKAVMVGSLLSGTEETPGEIVAFEKTGTCLRHYVNYKEAPENCWHKKYRGSASLESYGVQNKIADHRAAEGEATLVRYKGPVRQVILNLVGGIRSGMSYVGASNLTELRESAKFVRVTDSGKRESRAHAKEV
jgi:IMP dehydrogenase